MSSRPAVRLQQA